MTDRYFPLPALVGCIARCVVFLMCTGVTIQAADMDAVAEDFKPLSGYVVMSTEGEYIIDLDARKGVSIGDLFSVLGPGEKIIHPVTGEILGNLDESKGILKVTRLKSGYSHARPLGIAQGIKRGDPIRRFENIPAVFWDYTGKGKPFFLELRRTLPSLNWRDYAVAQTQQPEIPALLPGGAEVIYFILNTGGLEVRDPEFEVMHSYPSIESRASGGLVPSAGTSAPSMVTPTPGTSHGASAPDRLKASRTKPQPVVSYAPDFQGYEVLGPLPGVTVMSDFIRANGKLLLAATDGSGINVFAVEKDLMPLTTGALRTGEQVLGVQWWRPADSAPLYLAVTAWADQEVESTIFVLQDKKLVPFKERLPFLLGTFDRDGDGISETLLRQSFDRESFWGPQVKEIRLKNGRLQNVNLDSTIPRGFTVLGALWADLTGDGALESFFVRDRTLYVYAGKELRHKSAGEMGGSLAGITYDIDPGAKQPMFHSDAVEVSPVAADLDGDGQRELITVASDRFLLSAPGVSTGVKKSWLAVLKYRDGTFVSGTLGDTLETPVQGLTVDRDRVLFVTSDPGSILAKGRSQLLAYPLAR